MKGPPMLLHDSIKVLPILALAAVLIAAGGCSSQQGAAARQKQAGQPQAKTTHRASGTVNYSKNIHWGDEFAAN